MFARVIKNFKTPHVSTWIAGLVVGIPAGIWDIDTFAELSNIGTLFAFIVVSAGVIVLRKKQPERPRSFRVPFVPLVPIFRSCCLFLMTGLPLLTWIRFFVWLGIGLRDLCRFRQPPQRPDLNRRSYRSDSSQTSSAAAGFP